MTQLAFPYRFDARGRTAEVGPYEQHVANMVEQVLLTAPGERVNRPEFGAGLLELVFEPGGDILGEATAFLTRAALQRWLSDILRIEALSVRADAAGEGSLVVDLTYEVLATGAVLTQEVTRGASAV